jgi:response regulator of citrate/malate metabolism
MPLSYYINIRCNSGSDYTLETVEVLLAGTDEDLSATEVAERTGMSRATAQRYLTHLHDLGRVAVRLRYGVSGRPEHGYRWARPTACSPQ